MRRKRPSWPDILLAVLLAFGAALTASGGLRLLRDPSDVAGENAFVIGVGMLLPLLAILGLRLLPAPRRE